MSGTTRAARGVLDRLSAASLALAGASLAGMALVQAWQVFARYVLNDSPGWTEPVALILMSFTVMLGAAVCVRYETHFAFQTLLHASAQPVQAVLKAASRLLAAAAGLALAGLGGVLMVDDWSVSMAGAPLPSGLRFAALFVGGLLIVVFAIERLVLGDPQPATEG